MKWINTPKDDYPEFKDKTFFAFFPITIENWQTTETRWLEKVTVRYYRVYDRSTHEFKYKKSYFLD